MCDSSADLDMIALARMWGDDEVDGEDGEECPKAACETVRGDISNASRACVRERRRT